MYLYDHLILMQVAKKSAMSLNSLKFCNSMEFKEASIAFWKMHYTVGCQYKNINFTLLIDKIYKLCSILHEKHDRQFTKMVDSRELNFSRVRVLFKGWVSSAKQDLNSQGLVDPSSSTKMAENLFSLCLFYTKPVTQYLSTLWKKTVKKQECT